MTPEQLETNEAMRKSLAEKDVEISELRRVRDFAEEQIKTWEVEVERLKSVIARYCPAPDVDGSCLRCGLSWDGEKGDDDEHHCPPGFWNDYETEIERLKTAWEQQRQWRERVEDRYDKLDFEATEKEAEISKLRLECVNLQRDVGFREQEKEELLAKIAQLKDI